MRTTSPHFFFMNHKSSIIHESRDHPYIYIYTYVWVCCKNLWLFLLHPLTLLEVSELINLLSLFLSPKLRERYFVERERNRESLERQVCCCDYRKRRGVFGVLQIWGTILVGLPLLIDSDNNLQTSIIHTDDTYLGCSPHKNYWVVFVNFVGTYYFLFYPMDPLAWYD